MACARAGDEARAGAWCVKSSAQSVHARACGERRVRAVHMRCGKEEAPRRNAAPRCAGSRRALRRDKHYHCPRYRYHASIMIEDITVHANRPIKSAQRARQAVRARARQMLLRRHVI